MPTSGEFTQGRTYGVPDNNTLIEELIEIYSIDVGDIDDSVVVNANNVENGLETVCSFLQQQQESKHVRVLERYISLKSVSIIIMKQTTIIN